MAHDIEDALAVAGPRLTLTPALEAQFEIETSPSRITATRQFLVLALSADVCALGLDQAHGALRLGILIRLGLVAPFLIVAILLLSAKRRIWQQGVLTVLPIFFGLTSIALIGLLAGGRFAELYLSACGMVAILVNAILPLRFQHACLLTAITILATTVMVATIHGSADPSSLAGTLAFNAAMMVLTLSLNYRQEQIKRTSFVYEYRNRLQSKALLRANRELEASSRTDPLTGLLNRRALKDAMHEAGRQARRASGVYSLLMIDIDHFKRLNDTLGHTEGDRCICRVSDAIRSETRDDIDAVARFGGEEFVVVIPGRDEHAAHVIGARIKDAVTRCRIPHPGLSADGYVTVSIGGAISSDADNWDEHQVITRADAALYDAKSQGRNQVIIDQTRIQKDGRRGAGA